MATLQRDLLPSGGTSLPGCHLLLLPEAHWPAMWGWVGKGGSRTEGEIRRGRGVAVGPGK